MKKMDTICDNCSKDLLNEHRSEIYKRNEGTPNEKGICLPYINIHSATIQLSTTLGHDAMHLNEKDFCGSYCMFAYIRKKMRPKMLLGSKQIAVNEEVL